MKHLVLLFLLGLFSCQPASLYENDQLVGKWRAVEWKDVTRDKLLDANVQFTFGADGRYTGTYRSTTETGKYWLAGQYLHTIEDGKAEKKVEIKKLNPDTLVLGMNRMGTLEELTLVKE